MRQVLSTTDRSLAESFQISLEAEGIDAVVRNDNVATLPFIPITVAVLHEADYDRAVQLLDGLQVTTPAANSTVRRTPLLFIVILAVAVTLTCIGFFW
jgi:hypothetical protein